MISRPKPPFTEFDNIYEKLVDVNFLERMVQTREILNDEHLCDLLEERYYVYATILAFESWPKTYQACNNPQCYAAKVVLGDSYNYKCRKCENESVYFDPVLLAKIVLVDPERLPLRPVQDHLPRRGQPVRPPVITTAVFQQAAESVLGRTTAELNDLFVKKNKEEFREVCGRAVSRKLVFRLRANVFQDQIGFNVDRVFA